MPAFKPKYNTNFIAIWYWMCYKTLFLVKLPKILVADNASLHSLSQHSYNDSFTVLLYPAFEALKIKISVLPQIISRAWIFMH
jgi:hypothetical protein